MDECNFDEMFSRVCYIFFKIDKVLLMEKNTHENKKMQHGCFTYTGLLEGRYDSMYTSTTEDKETAETSNSVSI